MDSSSECPCSLSTSAETEPSILEIDGKKSKEEGEENRDRISELPTAIRSSILALLPLREAARTSVLSKCWRCCWTFHPNLDLVKANVLREGKLYDAGLTFSRCACSSNDDKLLSLEMKKYVDAVDQILKAHHKSRVDLFRVRFRLHDEYGPYLQRWIDQVAAFSPQTLEIIVGNAADGTPEKEVSVLYTVSASDFEARNRLRYLHFQRCHLVVPPPFGGFEFLKNLVLEYSWVTDEGLSRLLSKCLCLERLDLNRCLGLTRLQVGPALTNLRYITVAKCMTLEAIEIVSSVKLSRFLQHGRFGKFFVNVSKNSAVVDFVPKGRNFFTFTNFTCQIQELFLKFSYSCEPVHALHGVPTMKQLRVLRLESCTKGEKDMNWVFLLTNKCPFLEDLLLYTNVVGPFGQNLAYQKMDNFAKSHHYHLRVVSITRFYDHHECLVDLAVDLLIHAVRLRTMVINSPQSSHGRVSRRVCDLLRERASAGVELVFHRVVE